MKSCNKKLIKKFEPKIGLVKKRSGVIVIYNPDYPNLERASIDARCIIALPDNCMDQKLTEKIGEKFIIV